MSIVVDLPAPFGPSNATVSPGATETSIPRTALTSPYDLVSAVSSIPVVTPTRLTLPVRPLPGSTVTRPVFSTSRPSSSLGRCRR